VFRRFRPAKGAPAAAQRSWARRKAHPAVAELLKLKPGFTVQSCAIILASSKVSGGRAGGRQEDGLSGATTFGVRLAKPRKVRFVSRAATRSPASIGGPVSRSQCNEGFGAVPAFPRRTMLARYPPLWDVRRLGRQCPLNVDSSRLECVESRCGAVALGCFRPFRLAVP
jgi:hypothetical protein